ncbi:MAG TPA: hypothetical protein VKC89_03745 [Patescibacteria group bacterium]|nr:hypothetical protein [Patescibacteria group bacterium]
MEEKGISEPQRLFPDIEPEPSRNTGRPRYEPRRSMKYPENTTKLVLSPEDIETQVTSIQKIKESHRQQAETYRVRYGEMLDEVAEEKDQDQLETNHRDELDFVRGEIRRSKSPIDEKEVKRALEQDDVTPDQAWLLGIEALEKGNVPIGFQLFDRADALAELRGIKDPRFAYAKWKYHEKMSKYTRTEDKKLKGHVIQATTTRFTRPAQITTTSKPR